VAGTAAAVVLLGGCSAGQITQTATQVPAVNGAEGHVGPITVRDVQLGATPQGQHYYSQGASAPLIATIANAGTKDDALVSVTSPQFGGAKIEGDKAVLSGHSIASGDDSDDQTAPPAAEQAPGTVKITLNGCKNPALRPGITVPVTFTFSSGSVTVQAPIGAPSGARP
jgi:hypothetical protein